MKKIKEIKIINQDESTEIADIGANAVNVDYNNTTVKAELDKLNTDNSTNKNNITSLQSQVSSLASGSPAGVYATVAALTSANPDHNKIYVVTEDGHWYYYNNGWQNGGIYQAVSESKSITDIYNLIYNIMPKNSSAWEQGIYNDTDWTKTDSNWGIRLIDPLTFSKKGIYHVKTDDTYRIKIRLFNENDEIIYPGTTWITEETYIAINDNISYAKIHIGRKDGNKINVNVIPNVLISITYRPELSMKNLNEYHYGTLLNGSYTPSMVRMVTDFIPVDSNTAIHWAINDKYITKVYIYDETKTTVVESFEYRSHGTLETRATKKYIRFIIKNNIVPDGVILPSEIDLKISFTPKDYVRRNLITTNWENGSLSSEGEEINNQWSYQRLRSDFIPVYSKHYYRYYIGNTHQLAVYAYDENKNFLYQIIGYMTYNHEINGFNGFVRYVMKNTDSTAITPEDIDTCNIRIEEVTTNRANSIEAKRLKIMTNNVGHFSYGVGTGYDGNDIENQIQNWINLYKNQNPDILGIQEFWPIFERTQDHAMGIYKTRQSIYQKIFNDVFTGLFDMGVASNFEIINIENGMLGANNRSQARAYMHITYNINGKELHFFNIHAHPNDDATIRATQFDELITILNRYDTFICTGDYNAAFASEYDPFKTAGFNLANCGNFGEFYTYIHGDKPLDNIICSPNISINNVQKIDSNVTSDHYALVADIVIPLFDINY